MMAKIAVVLTCWIQFFIIVVSIDQRHTIADPTEGAMVKEEVDSLVV